MPKAVRVSGPGPVEPSATDDAASSNGLDQKPTPTVPADLIDDGDDDDNGDGAEPHDGEDDDDEDHITSASKPLAMDPYANLDDALGSLAGGGTSASKGHAEDDLLF